MRKFDGQNGLGRALAGGFKVIAAQGKTLMCGLQIGKGIAHGAFKGGNGSSARSRPYRAVVLLERHVITLFGTLDLVDYRDLAVNGESACSNARILL